VQQSVSELDKHESDKQEISKPSDPAPEEVGLVDLVIVLLERRSLLAKCFVVGTVVGIVIALSLPKLYVASAAIVPQQQPSLSSSMLSQLGPLASLVGKDGTKTPTDTLIAMIESRTIADAIIDQYDLMRVYGKKRKTDVRTKLWENVSVNAGKDGVIRIKVTDRDPNRSAAIANRYIVELRKMALALVVSEASQRRQFFESELLKAKDDLAGAEMDMRNTQESTGLIKLDDQAKAIIEATARIRGEIAFRQVQLNELRTSGTETNPDVIRSESALKTLQKQLAELETATTHRKGDIMVSSGRVPEVGLEYVRKLREVKYREALFEFFAKEFENAKIDEAKNPLTVQVMDSAIPPEKKSSPNTALIIIVSSCLGLAVGGFWLLMVAWSKNNPSEQYKLRRVRYLLRWQRPQED
jgi:tyrosine-protein kinase Etk/Wzc